MNSTENISFSKYINLNSEEIVNTLTEMQQHGQFYRTFRAVLSILQFIPPISFMSSYNDAPFSDALSDMFVGTSIMAFNVRTQHYGNMWSVPVGTPNSSRPLLQSIPFFNMIFWYKIYDEQKLNQKMYQRGISLTPEGKIDMTGIPNVTFYRSEKQQEFLDIKEQTAIGLYDITKNCLIFDALVNARLTSLVKYCLLITGGVALISGVSKLQRVLVTSLIIMVLLSILALYNNRKFVFDNDNIVNKTGYGDSLASALEKINKYNSGESFKMSGWNLPEQLINVLDTVYYQLAKVCSFLKINNTPYYKDRINILKDKNGSDINVDKNFVSMDELSEYDKKLLTQTIDKLDDFTSKMVTKFIVPTL